MTVTGPAYPADAVTGAPTFTSLQGRNSLAAAMGGATTARPLGGITGVRPGTPSTTVTASSTTWGVGAFAGYIDLQASVTNSGYFFSVAATASGGAVTAAVASARVDLIYVQIADSNTGDGTTGAPRIIVDYQAGVGGAGIPVLAAPRAFVIAQINVPATGGGSPTVTWVAPYTVAAGGILPVPTTVYPASPYLGQYVDDAVLGLLRWNGSAWKSLISDTGWLALTLAASWVDFGSAPYGTPRYRVTGGRTEVAIMMKSGTTTAGTTFATLPVGARPGNTLLLLGVNSAGGYVVVQVLSTGAMIAVSTLDATYTFFRLSFLQEA